MKARLVKNALFCVVVALGVSSCSPGAAPPDPAIAAAAPAGALSDVLSVPAVSKDPCTKYKGARLYTGVGLRENEQAIFSAKSNANGTDVPFLCEISNIAVIGLNQGLALDANDHLWVSSYTFRGVESLLVFSAHANGDVSPIQTISGSNTLLSGQSTGNYQGIAVDAPGNIWVPNMNGAGGYITEYANDANGNVAPIGTIGRGDNGQSEELKQPTAVAFDREGNLWVTNLGATVAVFTPPFSDNETPTALWTLPGSGSVYAQYVAIDPHDDVWIAGTFNLFGYRGGLKTGGVPTFSYSSMEAGIAG